MPILRSSEGRFLNKAPCFIIHKRPYKEHDFLLELFTLEYGRISAVCHQGKKSSFRQGALLQSFVPLYLTLFKGRSELYNVSEVKRAGCSFKLGLPKLFCAQYLNELIYRLCHEEESDPQLFAAYLKTLSILEQDIDPRLHLRRFETVLLNTLGYALSFEDNQGRPFSKENFYTFDPHAGFRLCQDPSLASYKGETLADIAQGKLSSDESLAVLKRIHSQILQMLMNYRPLQSHKLYSQYLSMQEI